MPTRPFVAALALVTLVAACGKPKGSAYIDQMKKMQVKMGNGGNSSSDAQSGDPCSLLDTADVAAAIGPLASAPYRGEFKPDADANACRYDTKNHRRVIVSVDWSGGPSVMKMIRFGRNLTDGISKSGDMKTGTTVLASGDTLVGDWDEIAVGPMQCCSLHALRGDQHIELDWTGTSLTTQAAGALLNSAVKRLDHPLAINGLGGVQAAQKEFDAEAKDSVLNMCTLVTESDVEGILGTKLLGPPTSGTAAGGTGLRSCTYNAPPGKGPPRQFELTLWEWHDGAVEFAKDQYVTAIASHALRKQLTGNNAATPADTMDHPPGPWDEAAMATSPGFEAVKGPVLIKVGAFGDRAIALAILAKAATAITTP